MENELVLHCYFFVVFFLSDQHLCSTDVSWGDLFVGDNTRIKSLYSSKELLALVLCQKPFPGR